MAQFPCKKPGNKRPDLRRDCDEVFKGQCLLCVCETNDLIYEGIATPKFCSLQQKLHSETNDLIYEGIATVGGKVFLPHVVNETNDLIYEGIATLP